MNSPPAVRPIQDIRLSPADGIALSRARYDLRARDGKRVCTVSRECAQRGILAGSLELWNGPAGAYLRSAALAYPEQARAVSRSLGRLPALSKGAVRPIVYSHLHATSGQVGGYRARRVGPGHTTPAA